MRVVETKTYELSITDEERKQLENTVDFLRNIEREIENTVGEDYPIKIECESYTSYELWRVANFLEGIAFDNYEM